MIAIPIIDIVAIIPCPYVIIYKPVQTTSSHFGDDSLQELPQKRCVIQERLVLWMLLL
jgi:hypothetical protein